MKLNTKRRKISFLHMEPGALDYRSRNGIESMITRKVCFKR
jgi:hypothetical protein